MCKERVRSFFFVLSCLTKLAFLYAEEEDCIFHCAVNKSTNVDLSFPKDEMNISGQCLCTVQHNNTYGGKNFTMEEKISFCCNNSVSEESLAKTLGEPVTLTIPDSYKYSNFSTNWYKDCKEYEKNTSEISFISIQQADSAVYTYIVTRMYNGENYTVCGKKLLKVKAQKKMVLFSNRFTTLNRLKQMRRGHRENINPKIIGIGEAIEEVEIGKNHTLKCEASVINNTTTDLYWIRENRTIDENPDDILDKCNKNMITKTCILNEGYDNQIMSTELYVVNISKDDIKYAYICRLQSNQGFDSRKFRLRLKDKNHDISKQVFTASLIASITCSVSIVFLVGLCILFRIQIVLLYRSITGVDETIGDGKEYDAYLSFESFSTCESDERNFTFETLAPILENCFGYKLCIFDRDVIPGGAMADDMNSFLEKSRRLIIVISKDFTSSKAMYELESGLHKAMVERKIKVILIEFSPLSEQSFQLESLQLLKTKNRVKWKGEKSRPLNSRFWKTIHYLMPAKPIKPCRSYAQLRKIQTDHNGKI
ncbi:interleukin-18 receptor 1-like isoform X1 [Hyla sarda]|uniref:interleukin-18 receptor 1-like isoform X1 n=1 Tax=Hyla sarda TaxID=327740 RepID=UPI0024C30142|nr:interleukin-18 receptor 1-like isoform X1 [Hyla sarda]